jgi:hypothetical protein
MQRISKFFLAPVIFPLKIDLKQKLSIRALKKPQRLLTLGTEP